MNTYVACTGSGCFELLLTQEQVDSVPRSGPADAYITALMKEESIARQIRDWNKAGLVRALLEYGAWERNDLRDHTSNCERMLWILVGNVQESPEGRMGHMSFPRCPRRSVMYRLELIAEEVRTLAAMGHKGYDCGICDALDAESVTYQTCVDGLEIYTIPEHIIWPVYERYSDMIIRGNDPWGPFVAETLRPKLHALMESVI